MPARSCPTCTRPLQPLYADHIELDRCFACAATWFDPGEFERVSGERGAPVMTREHPACGCPGCGEHLWFARIKDCDVLACVDCGGCFVTDVQARRATVDSPAPRRQWTMQFVCVGCKDRYALSEHQQVAAGLACARCAERLPAVPPPKQGGKTNAAPVSSSTNSVLDWGWVELVGALFDLFTIF